MSAFVVEPQTINRILTFLSIRDGSGAWLADKLKKDTEFDISTDSNTADLGQAMYNMNINAVSQRYPNSDLFNLPGTVTESGELVPYKYELVYNVSKYQAVKSLACFLYQCSEGNVEETALYKYFETVRIYWERDIINSIPEYRVAEWA